VVITFGKTAREANTGDAAPAGDWDIVVDVTVGSGSLSATGHAESYGYTVFFYSEVSSGAGTIDFGTIQAGQSSIIQSVDGSPGNTFTVTAANFGSVKKITLVRDLVYQKL